MRVMVMMMTVMVMKMLMSWRMRMMMMKRMNVQEHQIHDCYGDYAIDIEVMSSADYREPSIPQAAVSTADPSGGWTSEARAPAHPASSQKTNQIPQL